jgi:hypothetical protein
MHLQEITAEQYLAILQMGGDAVCTEHDLRFDDNTKEYFTRCEALDRGYGDTMWQMWAGSHSLYKHFYTVVE